MRKYKTLWIPAWYPTPFNPYYGIFIKEHARACSLYNEIVILYAHMANFFPQSKVEFSVDDSIPTYRIYNKRFPKLNTLIRFISIVKVFRKLWKERL
ncbi:MAG: hypothetical protein ACPLPS_07660 [bacterium]